MNYYYPNNSYMNPYQQVPVLNGKIVDNLDMVKIAEVPLGSYGVFPKGDLSEIYVKSWGLNGTTSVVCYKPAVTPEPQPQPTIDSVIDRLNQLEQKLDAVIAKKEVSANDY